MDNKVPLKGRGQGNMTHFQFRRPQPYLRNGWSASRQILCTGTDDKLPLSGVVRVM